MPSKRLIPVQGPPTQRVLSRDAAIAELAAALLKLCGRGAACGTTPGGDFCCGFQTWDHEAFRRRWATVMGKEPVTQARCERAANLCWQLHGTSRGWDVYSNDALAGLALEILGRRITIV